MGGPGQLRPGVGIGLGFLRTGPRTGCVSTRWNTEIQRMNDIAFELEALNYDIVFCTETWREERE